MLNILRISTLMLLLCNVLSIVPRSIQFWSRALHIYGSYKTHQLKSKINSTNNSSNILSWDQLHEENSKRMMDLCLSLRGFYLKTGFFDIIIISLSFYYNYSTT